MVLLSLPIKILIRRQENRPLVPTNTIEDAALGAFFDNLFPTKMKGVTSGRNSYSSVYKSGLTRLKNGTAKRMKMHVITKGTTASIVSDIVPAVVCGILDFLYEVTKARKG